MEITGKNQEVDWSPASISPLTGLDVLVAGERASGASSAGVTAFITIPRSPAVPSEDVQALSGHALGHTLPDAKL
ncbi:hypothetical protein E2C01_008726 [Portunus trituberculatus]|uniref:Uncharacterized protein n=1 Tax=Portunus trituberculatus TaxID=210409 RepID=A0A5B7D3S9_PORTR|nr:hypothetical protein [Portunus trituberculatus]